MAKLKYYFLFLILIVIIVAFKFNSYNENPEITTTDTIQTEVKEINYAIEIQESLQKYDSLLSSEINESGTIGAAVVIVYKNQITFLKCFGVRKAGDEDLVDKNTIFRLASVSKTVTGVLAGILSDEKVIDIDDKIVDYIPGFQLKNTASTNLLTVRNILSHTSGLIPHAYDNFVEEHVPFQKIFTSLSQVEISSPPGQMYAYQNVVFSLYDTITAVKTLKPFSEVIKEKIFIPFHMENASTGFEAFEASNNKAYPHFGTGEKSRSLKLNNRYYSTIPAAGVNASISDLAQFLMVLLNKDSEIVNNHVREIVFTPQVDSPLSRNYFRHWKNVKSKQYAIGWRTVEYENRNVAYHGGYVQGYRAEIALCFDENVGIAFLSNSPNSIGTKSVPAFLDLLFAQKDGQKFQHTKP